MTYDSTIDLIKTKLSEPLPGKPSHMKMASLGINHKYYEPSKDYKKAAVLAVLFYINDSINIIYMKRPGNNQNDKHSGQISFPGGQFEKDDESLEACAIRETNEELGLNPSDIEILGALSPLYIYVSNFMVYPYVAFYHNTPNYNLQKTEVENTIEFPFKNLYLENIVKVTDISIKNNTIKSVPYFNLNGEILWGATAMITNELKTIMQSEFLT